MKSWSFLLAGLVVAFLTGSNCAQLDSSHHLKAARVCSDDDTESVNNVCVIMVDQMDSVQVIVEAPQSVKGWLAVGFGTSMANSDAYIGFASGGKVPTILDYKLGSKGHGIGKIDPIQNVELLKPFGLVSKTHRFVIAFTRAKDTKDKNDAIIDTKRSIPLIWAYNSLPQSVKGEGKKATFATHQAKGTMNLDFNDTNHVAAAQKILTPNPAKSVSDLENGDMDDAPLDETDPDTMDESLDDKLASDIPDSPVPSDPTPTPTEAEQHTEIEKPGADEVPPSNDASHLSLSILSTVILTSLVSGLLL